MKKRGQDEPDSAKHLSRAERRSMRSLKRGQTISGEREYAESESERMQARRRVRRKHFTSILLVFSLVLLLGILGYISARNIVDKVQQLPEPDTPALSIKSVVVDESGRGQISSRTKEYIVTLEQDFRDLGYTVTKVTLPTGATRELYVDLSGETTYFKINLDRDPAVSAEDATRMLKYLKEHSLSPTYVDVRVEGKAYYK